VVCVGFRKLYFMRFLNISCHSKHYFFQSKLYFDF
jgi:hypothetical protein